MEANGSSSRATDVHTLSPPDHLHSQKTNPAPHAAKSSLSAWLDLESPGRNTSWSVGEGVSEEHN